MPQVLEEKEENIHPSHLLNNHDYKSPIGAVNYRWSQLGVVQPSSRGQAGKYDFFLEKCEFGALK
jgi:hypothetical protein